MSRVCPAQVCSLWCPRGLRGFSFLPLISIIIITINNGPGGKRIDSKTKS